MSNSKVLKISSQNSGALTVNNTYLKNSSISSEVSIDGFMNIDKIAKLVKVLVNNDISKIKDIIECDIDKELSAFLILHNHFDDSYLLEIFSIYLKSSEMDEKSFKLFKIIINKLETLGSLKKSKKILEDSFSRNDYYFKNLIQEIDSASSRIPVSVDYILDD